MYRPTRPGSAAAKKKYEGWRFHQPSLPWSSHHTLQHGAFLRADQVPGDVLRLRSVPSRVSRQGLSASVGPREPIKVAFDGSLSRFPCPKARVPLDVVGKWERHRFSPLPHASSFDRPASRSNGGHPCGRPPLSRWQWPEAFVRFRRDTPSPRNGGCACFRSRAKRILPVDKENPGDNFSPGSNGSDLTIGQSSSGQEPPFSEPAVTKIAAAI